MREQIDKVKNFEQFLNKTDKQSTKPKIFYKNLIDDFGDIGKFNRPTGEFLETIDFNIKNKFNEEFLKFLDANNWYVAKHNNQNIGELKPKYSIEGIVEQIPKTLLHATPIDNVESILKNGLKASSNDLRHKYPNRIYLASKLNTIKQLIIEMKRYSGIDDYVILKINTNKMNTILYKDDTCAYFDCYYIQDYNIPSSMIKIAK